MKRVLLVEDDDAVAVLSKPFDIDHLCTVVDKLTRNAPATIGEAVPQT